MESIDVGREYLQTHGFQLPQGQCNVKIELAMFDTKMAGILNGAGGAACHLFTSTREQLKDKHIIQHWLPINRNIQLAREIFLNQIQYHPHTNFNDRYLTSFSIT